MTLFDLSRLGAWSDLPFFNETLPLIETALEAEHRPVFPPAPAVFHAFERTQPRDTRVVILGQDPYHTPGKADGLAFSIPTGFGGRLDSLGNIFKEIETDLGQPRSRTDLSDWADQGVLLLNTALTVPQGAAKAHAKLGWSVLVDQVLAELAGAPRAYLLWGGPAQKAAKNVDAGANLKIESAHPSPLSVHRGFFGSRPFSRTNEWLQARGLAPINWGDPEGL
ncbi:Uracil-DNA glycosylase [Sulfitobacter noctilucicola]|uniref:Uracil-DNA glycosylase n=1 Tax=Sulfitobacter noctilucicola TaxID=1342301 RepID=A0A7W6M7W9_9RHOB|nr:uracil-DNA glycosylase [Sulfitobacter noctilucicola]KIN64775.1 Uracil-DNA glycosylase [Sulfitobacter noctilucicola]MBB4174079.1 uracil-DNA glycosylase [Sulfitobacter noctilucicola]